MPSNPLNTATAINLTASPAVLNDTITSATPNKIYRFSLATRSSLNLSISGLSANATVQLIQDRNHNGAIDAGDVIASSTQSGTIAKSISRALEPGTYYVRISASTPGISTSYRLNAFAPQASQSGSVVTDYGSDGKLKTFAIAGDDNVWVWQQSDNNDTYWHKMGFLAKSLQAIQGSDGKLDVFGIGLDDKAWEWKESDNNFTYWHDLGFKAKSLQAISVSDGRVNVFGIGLDDKAWEWKETDNNFTYWHDLGFKAKSLQTVQGGDGNLNVFGIGLDDKAWEWKEGDNNFTYWHDLGFKAKRLQPVYGSDGKLDVFGTGLDDKAWEWKESDNNFTYWHDLGFKAKRLQTIQGGDGKLDVFGIGLDDKAWEWKESDNNFTYWHDLGFKAASLRIVQDGNAKLDVFGIGLDDKAWEWKEGDNNFTYWHDLGAKLKTLHIVQGTDGKLNVFAVGLDNKAWEWKESDNNFTYWHDLGLVAKDPLNQIYRDVLGRDDDSSSRSWLDALEQNWTLQGVRNAIAHSAEAQTKLNQIYRDVLGRDADSGSISWLDALGRDATLQGVRNAIAHSAEAQTKLNQIYRDVLGRDADSGSVSWLDALGRDWTLQTVRNAISSSSEAKLRNTSSSSQTSSGATINTSSNGSNNSNLAGASSKYASLDEVTYEHFARYTAYDTSLRQGDLVIENNGHSYRVEKVFDDSWSGFHAVGLKADNPNDPYVLAIRGTEINKGAQTLVANFLGDINSTSVGQPQFKGNVTDIENWLRDHPGSDIVGHSLGGALAQEFAADFTAQGNRVGNIITFNSPGIASFYSSELVSQNAKNVTNYIISGDIVSLAGISYLPGEYRLVSFHDLNLLNKHIPMPDEQLTSIGASVSQSTSYLSSPSFHYEDADYFAFLLAVAALEPMLAVALFTRAGVESLRAYPESLLEPTLLMAESAIGEFTSKVKSVAQQWGSDVWNNVSHWTSNDWNIAANWTTDIWNSTTQSIADVWSNTANLTSNFWKSLWNR